MTDCLLNPKPNSKQMDITDAWYIWTVSSSLAWSWHALLLNTSSRWLAELIKTKLFAIFQHVWDNRLHSCAFCGLLWNSLSRKSDIVVISLSFSLFCDYCIWLIQLLTLWHYSAHSSNCCINKKATRAVCSACRW